ncbi:hypothetical protein [Aquabacterium sp.]|uniref:hypothetical protein n=1 Tax=Aquabacterium sp. TaxID=1872578 RepID=UPI0027B91D7C|nr:hypothetical protein [Aquabacterium sp.]
MLLLDEMLALNLLTADQHTEIGAWVRQARTPDRILQMPTHLWKVLEGASVLMDFDPDGVDSGGATATLH